MFLNTALSFSTVWSKVWPFLVAILFFGIVIMFHELGHFLFAKLFKVKVNEFSIGMGPAIFKKKKDDTNYAVRILPIGGYVSMEGEDEDSEVSDLARELYYSSLLLQELVEWYQSRRQERENYEEEYEQYHGFDMTMM